MLYYKAQIKVYHRNDWVWLTIEFKKSDVDYIKKHLNVFKNLEGTVAEKINTLTNKVKGILGYDGNNTLIQALDLSYHTVFGVPSSESCRSMSRYLQNS